MLIQVGVLYAGGKMTVADRKENNVAVSYKSIKDLLEKEEGFSKKIYLDTKGIPTGGYGHAFQVGSELPGAIWELIFHHDLGQAREKFETLGLGHLSERRQWVCIAMIYQMGFDGFLGFKETIKYLRKEDYVSASKEMLNSKWAKIDTPERALRMSEVMLHG